MGNEMTATEFTGQETRPDLDLIASDAIRLESLIEAMDALTDRLGPDSGPVYACIASALPIAKRISRQLDNLSTHTGTAMECRADSSLKETAKRPLVNLFAQWRAMTAYCDDSEISDDIGIKACNVANDIVHLMLCVPAVTAADLALKIVAYSSDGIHEAGPDSGNGSDALWTEIRALAGMTRAHVEPVKTD
jgi:hypothetical protein